MSLGFDKLIFISRFFKQKADTPCETKIFRVSRQVLGDLEQTPKQLAYGPVVVLLATVFFHLVL